MRRLLIIALLVLQSAPLFADETTREQQPLSIAQDQQVPEIKWLWGEVLSVDQAARKLQVRYADFETDTDQETTLQANERTVVEGVASFAEIKTGDTISVDYSVTDQGFNLAETISVERIEDEEGQLKADIPLEQVLAEETGESNKDAAVKPGD